jgi:hypothetical protein
MTPKLRSLYGLQGDWQQIISAVMDLPPDMPALIQGLWAKNTEVARNKGAVLTPEEFAQMFVDKNLVN